jgi:arabinose-5-phosphate isomerase
MGDALAVACYERRGFSPEDFARFHPGGRLGRKLQRVEPLMHRGDALPVVPSGAGMQEATRVLNEGKLGVVCVVDEAGGLAGILTDGDLRRRLLSVERPLEGEVNDAMIAGPLTVEPDALAGEALKLMEERKVTSLPVVDGDGALLGLIHIHDLWRTELF